VATFKYVDKYINSVVLVVQLTGVKGVTTAIPGAEGEMRFVFRDEVLAQLLGDIEPTHYF